MGAPHTPATHIEVEGDKPKVARTRKHFAKETEKQRRDRELQERFGSAIQLSVKVLRPADKYPYEREVWTSEIRVPIEDGNENVRAVVDAWIATMEAGIALAKAFGDAKEATT